MELFTELKVLGLRFLMAKMGIKFNEKDFKEIKDFKNLLSSLSSGVNKVADSFSAQKIKMNLDEASKNAKDDIIFWGVLMAAIFLIIIIVNNSFVMTNLLFAIIKTLEISLSLTSFFFLISLFVFRILKKIR
jgi:uncharacterized protein YqhQ